MNKSSISAIIGAAAITLLIACGPAGTPHTDTLDSGTIKVTCDDSYEFLIDSEASTFMALNPEAHLNVSYKPETETFADILKDSARVIIVNRELTETEKQVFDSAKISSHTSRIAFDAVALIVNKSNPDTNLTTEHLAYIFSNRITKWKDVNKKSPLGNMQVVFDNTNSGNARYIKEHFKVDKFPDYCQAAKTNREVIKFVEENPNAIGIIGVNWISDRDDSTSMNFLSKIKVVNICEAKDTTMAHDFFPPLAGHVALKEYPLWRTVYMIKREPYNGLGTGFVNFCYGDKGQRIIKLMGLLPANIKAQIIRVK